MMFMAMSLRLADDETEAPRRRAGLQHKSMQEVARRRSGSRWRTTAAPNCSTGPRRGPDPVRRGSGAPWPAICPTLPELPHAAEPTLGPDCTVRDYGLLEARPLPTRSALSRILSAPGASHESNTPAGTARAARPTASHKYFLAIITVLIIGLVIMDAVRWLRESGLKVEDLTSAGADAPVDSVLEVAAGDHGARFAVQAKGRAPYPHEVGRLQRSRHERAQHGHPLMVAPFISETLGSTLTREGWSWADAQGNFDLRAPGLILRQRRTSVAPVPKQRTLPRGSGSYAVIRALVGFNGGEDEEPGATALAAQAGISQPRASQVLRNLHDLKLVDISGHGHWKPHREALLDRFLTEYPGPGGSEEYYYTLSSPVDVAVRAGQVSTPARPIAVSADVGPDLIAGWRRPSLVILYARHAIDPSDLGLTDALGRHDANVIMRAPQDRSVFPVPALTGHVQGHEVPLADPLQQIWDLQDLGGEDRIEAAGRLREWLLERP